MEISGNIESNDGNISIVADVRNREEGHVQDHPPAELEVGKSENQNFKTFVPTSQSSAKSISHVARGDGVCEGWKHDRGGHSYNPTTKELQQHRKMMSRIPADGDEVAICAAYKSGIQIHRKVLTGMSEQFQNILLNKEIYNIAINATMEDQIYTLEKFIKREPIDACELMNEGMLFLAHKFELNTLCQLCWTASAHEGQSFDEILSVYYNPLKMFGEVPSIFWHNFLRVLYLFASEGQKDGIDWERYMSRKRDAMFTSGDNQLSATKHESQDADDGIQKECSGGPKDSVDQTDIWDIIIRHRMLEAVCQVIMNARGFDGVLYVIYNSLFSKLSMANLHELLIDLGLRDGRLTKDAEVHYIRWPRSQSMRVDLIDSNPEEEMEGNQCATSAIFPGAMGLIRTNPGAKEVWKDYTRALVFSVHPFFLTLRWKFPSSGGELLVVLEKGGSDIVERVFQPHLPVAVNLKVMVACNCDELSGKEFGTTPIQTILLLDEKVSTFPQSTPLSSGRDMKDLIDAHQDDCGIVCELMFEYLGDNHICEMIIEK